MYTKNRNWNLYNQQLVNRGKVLTLFLSEKTLNWKDELKEMNRRKRGSPYRYPNALIWAGFAMKCIFRQGYRQLQGFIEEFCTKLNFSAPDFRTFWWRIDKLERQGVKFSVQRDRKINVAVDSTGIKLVNDGEYRTMKYNKTKSWVKFHTAVAENSGEALNIIITKDNVGDCREFVPLLDSITKIVRRADTDKAYDTNANFEYCREKGIDAGIPVKLNASPNGIGPRCDAIRKQFGIRIKAGRRPKNLHVLNSEERERNQNIWSKRIGRGMRWHVEGFYSRFKREYGESVFSKKQKNVYNEIVMKTNILNRFITM